MTAVEATQFEENNVPGPDVFGSFAAVNAIETADRASLDFIAGGLDYLARRKAASLNGGADYDDDEPMDSRQTEPEKTSNWRTRAACRKEDPEWFYGLEGEQYKNKKRREMRAKEICRMCPVMKDCQYEATTNGERYGVWGGMGEDELKRARSRRIA